MLWDVYGLRHQTLRVAMPLWSIGLRPFDKVEFATATSLRKIMISHLKDASASVSLFRKMWRRQSRSWAQSLKTLEVAKLTKSRPWHTWTCCVSHTWCNRLRNAFVTTCSIARRRTWLLWLSRSMSWLNHCVQRQTYAHRRLASRIDRDKRNCKASTS